MNKRIRELAEQATLPGYMLGESYVQSRLDEQKFAELIVAECEKAILAEIAITDISGEVEKAWEMGMECGVYTIKKHFEVKE
jgi:hypothetical protein